MMHDYVCITSQRALRQGSDGKRAVGSRWDDAPHWPLRRYTAIKAAVRKSIYGSIHV